MTILSKLTVLVCISITLSCSETPTVATINSTRITAQELNTFCQRKAALLGVKELPADGKREVLESLIRREVVFLYAKKNSITPPGDEMKNAMKSFTFVEKILKRKEIEKNLLLDQMRKKMAGNMRASRKEVEDYYRANRGEFSQPEQYRVYLVKVEEADADHVLQKLKAYPEAFDDMALKRVSRDLTDLNKNAPYAPKSDFPEEMWPYLEKMKVGEVGGPVTFKRGMYIFKLVGKKPAALKPLSGVYMEIDHLLTAQKREDAFDQWYVSIKGNYKIEIKEKNL